MLVKIEEVANQFGISPIGLEDYLKKHHPDLLHVTKGLFRKKTMMNDDDCDEVLREFQKYEEVKEKERIDFIESFHKPICFKVEAKEQQDWNQEDPGNTEHDERYEYAIVTMLNNDWRIDVEKYVKVLNEKAKNGWRLCNVYTNELGKEARRVLGYGINSVVYEDVLIFERRILKGELINYTDK